MATRFLHLDLSPDNRDFEQLALEPGFPLLDRLSKNYGVLHKWLGRLVAQPEWSGNKVSFFVCNDRGSRPQDVRCEPASSQDLSSVKGLRKDLAEIKQRLKQAIPSAAEKTLHAAIVRHMEGIDNAAATQSDCHFFKYRDQGVWHLVWAWGFQRKDMEPAIVTICTNPACRRLFLRRKEGSRDCPACAQAVPLTVPKKRRTQSGALGLLVLIAAIAGIGAYLLRDRFLPLVAVPAPNPAIAKLSMAALPAQWAGPAGSTQKFRVVLHKPGANDEDVSSQVVAISENPQIARIERNGISLIARAPGKTALRFYLGDHQAQATVEVGPPKNPGKFRLEPANLVLGVGTTARIHVLGDYEGGSVDLTETAEWLPVTSSALTCHAGKVEGVLPGEATIAARYRATPGDPYVTAEMKVKVVEESYTALYLAVTPGKFPVGSGAAIEIQALNNAGEKRSVLSSSQAVLTVSDPKIATIERGRLKGTGVGKGKITASFQKLTATGDFEVVSDVGDEFVVTPNDLRLFVGEVAQLQVSGGSGPVEIVSSSPKIAATSAGAKVIGLAIGKAQLTVARETREAKVEVEVVVPNLKEIAFVPERISVPIDGPAPVRVVGRTADGQQFDLSADAIRWEDLPSSNLVEFDLHKLQLLGRRLTGDTPQIITARVGDLRARGQIDVVAAPLRLELTPPGPVSLSAGQTAQAHAWATFGGGRRVEISADRLQWNPQPADSADIGLETTTGTVHAVKVGGKLSVGAHYLGFSSNRVEYQVGAEALSLALSADRSVILVNDRGNITSRAIGSSPGQALTGVEYETSNKDILTIDRTSGEYTAVAPGSVTVTARHPGAAMPATKELKIVARNEARLELRPTNIVLMVGTRQPIELFLIGGGGEEKLSLVDRAAGVQLGVANVDAVRLQASNLVGLKPSEPFDLTAEYQDLKARAGIRVLAGDGDIRVAPDHARLSPGQALSPRIEQKAPDANTWLEVEPSRVKWTVPSAIHWVAAQDDLGPQLTLADSAQGKSMLEAAYAGKKAALEIEVAGDPPPSGDLVVVREPAGDQLAVDSRQRFSIQVKQGNKLVPAADVQWTPTFENEDFKWVPPELIAKRAGSEQTLSARVGDQNISFDTHSVGATGIVPRPESPVGAPAEVRITTDQKQPITIPVRGRFAQFHVYAVYPGRPPIDVTPEAILTVVETKEQPTPIAVSQSIVEGEAPGKAEIRAEYNGVQSKSGLGFVVVDTVDLQRLQIIPAKVEMGEGESVTLKVTGYTGDGKEERLLGDVTALANLRWQSDNAEIVRGDGPTLAGLKPGNATITLTSGKASANVAVTVLAKGVRGADALMVSPSELRIRVGESRTIGHDVNVRRGEADVSDQVELTSSAPAVVRYDREQRSLEGLAPGKARVAVSDGMRSATISVIVEPSLVESGDGTIIVEPGSGNLAVGETQSLRIFLQSKEGTRADRTGSAIVSSVDPTVLSTNDNRVTALAAGRGTVHVTLPGITKTADAIFITREEQFTSLTVNPNPILLQVGQQSSLRIEGVGPVGRRLLGEHPDLKITLAGAQPACVECFGSHAIHGLTPGKALLNVAWPGAPTVSVPVTVSADPITGLRIEPPEAHVRAGGQTSLLVFARSGDHERPVTAEDGVQLQIGDTSIAEVEKGQLAVRGVRAGITEIVAQLGAQRAAARLVVSGGSDEPRTTSVPAGLHFIPDVLRLRGVPSASVQLVKYASDGSIEAVNQLPEFNILPPGQDVVDIHWTESGPVVTAKKNGEADISAKIGNLATARPLHVVVNHPVGEQSHAGLEVWPNPLRLAVGQTGGFQRVQIVSAAGGAPHDVDYRIEPKDSKIVKVDADGKRLHALASGQEIIAIRPVGAPGEFANLSADVTVAVDGPASTTAANTGNTLWHFTGPSRTSVGAEVQIRAELVQGNNRTDVTNAGATLVLDGDQAAAAEILPGCRFIARQPVTLNLRARYRDSVSGVFHVAVDPPTKSFSKLEIEIDRSPMVVGETRSYKLWGDPADGGPRHDLTRLTKTLGTYQKDADPVVALTILSSNAMAEVATHVPPTVIASGPGQFRLLAAFGEARSAAVDLEVVANSMENARLAADPAIVTIHVGDRVPPIRVTQTGGNGVARQVEAQWASENETVLSPDAQSPGRFVGRSLGQTRLKASVGKSAVEVQVIVSGDPFEKVTIQPDPSHTGGNQFTVVVSVEASNSPDEKLEYRVVSADNSNIGAWKLSPSGQPQKFDLTSPAMTQGPNGTKYNLTIEARDSQQKIVARYPLSFKLDTKITQSNGETQKHD